MARHNKIYRENKRKREIASERLEENEKKKKNQRQKQQQNYKKKMKRDNNNRKEVRKVEDKREKERKDMILICIYKFFLKAKKRNLDHNKRRSSGIR